MNDCCREELKKLIEWFNDMGYIDIHGDYTVDSVLEMFLANENIKEK